MFDGPRIASVASLLGDPARANMLCALMDGRALTATELALEGGVSKQTASGHLQRMTDAGLLAREVQGRHRYFRLADADVAQAIEVLMGVAQRSSGERVRPGPRDAAMRRARVCYDHLAGDVAVAFYDRLRDGGLIHTSTENIELTVAGGAAFEKRGFDVARLAAGRRPVCRSCLDWSERRHHLAGSLGAAVLAFAFEKRWARRHESSRLVTIEPRGEAALMRLAQPVG